MKNIITKKVNALHLLDTFLFYFQVLHCPPVASWGAYNVSNKNTSYNDVIEVSCGSNTSVHICSHEAKWKPSIPTCKGRESHDFLKNITPQKY